MSGNGDYISREAVLALAKDICVITKWDSEYRHRSIDPLDVIEIPAADVRPVVLCRDCIFHSNEWTGCPKLNGTITYDEFFCKCGIKREES